jgi:hypothetical protein
MIRNVPACRTENVVSKNTRVLSLPCSVRRIRMVTKQLIVYYTWSISRSWYTFGTNIITTGNRNCLVGIAETTSWKAESRQGQEICIYFTASRPALGLTQPLIHWGGSFLGVKAAWTWSWPLTSNAEVKNGGAIHPLPNMSSWRGA